MRDAQVRELIRVNMTAVRDWTLGEMEHDRQMIGALDDTLGKLKSLSLDCAVRVDAIIEILTQPRLKLFGFTIVGGVFNKAALNALTISMKNKLMEAAVERDEHEKKTQEASAKYLTEQAKTPAEGCGEGVGGDTPSGEATKAEPTSCVNKGL